MKKRIATLLTLVLSTAMLLCGCGGNEATETMNNNSGNSSGGLLSGITNKKSELLSECLSEEKVIGYVVETVDKAKTPQNIFFFDNGKVTIIPGGQFGLTMGDYAKMSDEEIWKTYETVKEAYIEKYNNEQVESYIYSIQEQINDLENSVQPIKYALSEVSNSKGTEDYNRMLGGLAGKVCYSTYDDSELETSWEAEDKLYQYQDGKISVEDFESYIIPVVENRIALIDRDIEALQAKIDEVSTSQCAVPFSDIPFKFIIETNSSGNKVASEFMVYPTLDYEIGTEIPHPLYDKLSFAQGLTREEVIYDSTYNCIATTGSGSFLTREKMDLDTSFDSEYLLIDLSDDELNELFKEEVTKRYECN